MYATLSLVPIDTFVLIVDIWVNEFQSRQTHVEVMLSSSSSIQRIFWCTVIVVTYCFVPTTLSLVPLRKVTVANRSVSPQQKPHWPSIRRDTTVSLSCSMNRESSDPPRPESEKRRMGELTPSEQVVYDTLCAGAQYSFRIVVVGSGAILETTVPRLGPHFKMLQSPSTVANMATFANEDQSFEYHVQLEQVREIAFVEKETPKKTLRIVRLVNADGATMTSLILVDTSDEAQQWFGDMIQRHGSVIQL